MTLNVATSLKTPGQTYGFEAKTGWSDMEYGGRYVKFAEPVSLVGTYVFDNDGFTLKGTIMTALDSECARCTAPFVEKLEIEFSERFVKEISDDDDESYVFTGTVIDITQMIRDNILLNLSISSICSEDCLGLCPVCGCNLNISRCDCIVKDSDNPFHKLEQLLKDDKEV